MTIATAFFIVITFLIEVIMDYLFEPSPLTMLLVPFPIMLVLGLIFRDIILEQRKSELRLLHLRNLVFNIHTDFEKKSLQISSDDKKLCICLMCIYLLLSWLFCIMLLNARSFVDREDKKKEILVEISNDKELIYGLDDMELYQTAINRGYTISQEGDEVVFKK